METNNASNPLFHLAESFVNHTNRHIFLTGKAGTGKTTFLHHIRQTAVKNSVVVAPTGVAAINARGVTIHSFFQLPFGIYNPSSSLSVGGTEDSRSFDRNQLLENLRMNTNKRKLIRDLELLIIDEVSMVRADVMDAIDTVLRHIRKRPQQPFGGVQLLLIGDLFQLSPVVTESEREIFEENYQTAFFFGARVFNEAPPVCIELQKIYRQSDQYFINLLNKIRNNNVTEDDLDWINGFYRPDFNPDQADNYVTLTTHNQKARKINEQKLAELPGKVYRFDASVEGEFQENAFPADTTLQLKKGAQVMFIRNDTGEERRYYNGKLATISSLSEDEIKVFFPEEGTEMVLEKEEWKNVRYTYNEEKKKIEEKELGSFHQYPIRLAWAITIHKSQGLTFSKAIVDAGSSFSPGQVYVALSRLSGTEGLILHSKIPRNSIYCHEEVLEFMSNMNQNAEALESLLGKEQVVFIHDLLTSTFNWDDVIGAIQQHIADYQEKQVAYREDVLKHAQEWLKEAQQETKVADKFVKELQTILSRGEEGYPHLYERLKAAQEYFSKRLKEHLWDPVESQKNEYYKKKNIKKYLRELNGLLVNIKDKKKQIERATVLAEGLMKGEDSKQLLRYLDNRKKEEPPEVESVKSTKGKKSQKGESQRITLKMFQEGHSIESIMKERDLAQSTVENHLMGFIKTGDISVYDFVDEEKINTILPLVKESEDNKSTPIKNQLGDDYSYNEIRAVVYHWVRAQEEGQTNEVSE